MKTQKTITQNFFLLPFVMVFFMFGFLFVALGGSNYFFEKKVLITAFLFVLLWGFLFINSVLKRKDIKINIYNIILFVLFFIFCLVLIRQIWFSHYLRIDAVKRFFNGQTFIDTLYHSALAESIVTNGYPSIQQNASNFLAYHCFSHYIIASISKLLEIPSFITYNYLYPIIFIPFLLFLIQKIGYIGKKYYDSNSGLEFGDYVLLLGFIIGFFTKNIQKSLACNLYVNLFNSESCLISVIILLLYFFVIEKGYNNIVGFGRINLFLLIPLFIVALLYSKISFGILFALGVSYYIFRKYFLKNKKCLIMIIYLAIITIYYITQQKFSVFYPNPLASETRGENILFHYVRTYCKNNLYRPFHYGFLFLPIFTTIYAQRDIIFKNIFHYKKECIFTEMSFILMIIACLPGIVMNISGGAAFYFIIPVYVLSWMVFICSGSKEIFSRLVISVYNDNRIFFNELFFSTLIFLVVFSTCFNDMYLQKSIIQTLRSRISLVGLKKDIPGKVKELFMPVDVVSDNNYLLFNKIRKTVSRSKKDYCLFVLEDSDFVAKYDYIFDKAENYPRLYGCRPYLGISAYIGLPIINSIYKHNFWFFRGDDWEYGLYRDIAGYSIPQALVYNDIKITEKNMIDYAKKLKKKHIIVIGNDYRVIDLE